jgi:apolipoprotein N-acyltransferase
VPDAYNPGMDLAKLLIIAVLAAIIFSLGSALFQLSRGKGDSKKMLRALTWRIALSVALFLVLLIAGRMGYIRPHGLQ